jgi:hypothetical protein
VKTIRLEIELTYDDDAMHCGETDQEAKELFYNLLLFPQDRLILHSNDITDEVGDVKVLSITDNQLPAVRSDALWADLVEFVSDTACTCEPLFADQPDGALDGPLCERCKLIERAGGVTGESKQ